MQLKEFFPNEFPRIPGGKYVSVLSVKRTMDNTVFRTDEDSLNIARVTKGVTHQEITSRIQVLSRKQSTPERLSGRSRLRELSLLGESECVYNGMDRLCGKCPDCMIYGFAMGEAGSQKSRFLGGSLYSLSSFEKSQTLLQRSAIGEAGTNLTEPGDDKVHRTTLFQENVVNPEITFLSVESLRDVTYEGLLYGLQNILETKRYGAVSSRQGGLQTTIVGIICTGGEIFSNLLWTQSLYDRIGEGENTPIDNLLLEAGRAAQELLQGECCRVYCSYFGSDLESLLASLQPLFRNPAQCKEYHRVLCEQSQLFATQFGVAADRGKRKRRE